MILATQCEVDPQEAARLNREATVDEAAEEAKGQAAGGGEQRAVSTGPGSPAALRALRRAAGRGAASSSGAASPARSGAPPDGVPCLRRFGSRLGCGVTSPDPERFVSGDGQANAGPLVPVVRHP